MKCTSCGKEIADDSKFCEYCGTAIAPNCPKASVFGILVSFLIPLIGFILYGANSKKNPNAAEKYLWWSISGFVIGIILNIIAEIL